MRKLLLLLFLFTFSVSMMADNYVVNSAKLNVRATPSASGKLLGKLTKGAVIDVTSISKGFAKFTYNGKTGYVSAKYLTKQAVKEAAPAQEQQPVVEEQQPIEEVPSSVSTIYFFFDSKFYYPSVPIAFNGEQVFGMEGKVCESKMTGTRYSESMRKITVRGEGRIVISCDVTWADKPYHNELPLTVSDGGVYYVKYHVAGIIDGFINKRNFIMEQIPIKKGLKELEKAGKKYTVNDDIEYILK